MKKLLGLTFVLTSMVALSAPQGSKDETATMNITATVIEPLTVEAQPMAFGRIIKGIEGKATSTFTITGEEGAQVNFMIPASTDLTSKVGNKTMTVNFTTKNDGNFKRNGDGNGTLATGSNIVTVTGTIPNTDQTGTFEGTLVATVRYN